MKIQKEFSLQPLSAEAKAANQEKNLREAAKMYEGHFLNTMVKAMRKTVDNDNGLIKRNSAEKIFSEQLDQKYVEGWTDRGGVGLADLIYNQIKDRFLNTTKKDFSKPPGPLPVSPQKSPHGAGAADSIQMKALPPTKANELSYRFETPDPSGGVFEALSPFSGTVKESTSLADGWQLVKLDHGQGLHSELTFPGARAEIVGGQVVEAGQKLGGLDPRRPVLAWKLDWT